MLPRLVSKVVLLLAQSSPRSVLLRRAAGKPKNALGIIIISSLFFSDKQMITLTFGNRPQSAQNSLERR